MVTSPTLQAVCRRPQTPDWELGEQLYRADQLTLRQMAAQLGCAESAIRKRASRLGWQRDLTTRIQQAVQAQLVRGEVRKVRSAETPLDDQIIIEGAAAATLLALDSHDHMIGRVKAVARALLSELERENEATSDRLPLVQRVDALKKLGETAAKAITLERDALNMGSSTTETYEERIARLALDHQ